MGQKDLIWTNHASSRMRQRGIKEFDVIATWRSPDHTRKAATKGAYVYYKSFGSKRIEVVAKKNERGEWVVLSVWSKPVYEKYQKKRSNIFVILLKKILGI